MIDVHILDSNVMTISFGGERKFKIKYEPVKKTDNQLIITRDYITKNNSYLIMYINPYVTKK
jgi:hypothetical protein